MDSMLGRRRADAHQDTRENAAEKALSEFIREIADVTSDQRTASDQRTIQPITSVQPGDTPFSDAPLGARPSLDTTARPANLKDDRFRSVNPSVARRASRALTRFLIAAFIGVGSILAWQAYGDAAREKVASLAPQLGWVRLLPTLKPAPVMVSEPADPPVVRESSRDSAQAASSAPDSVALVALAGLAPEVQQQLQVIARDVAALRQSVEQLAAGQEQMVRNIAKLEMAEKDIRSKISAPKPTAAAPRNPALKLPPPTTQIVAPPTSAPLPPTDVKPRITN